MSTRGHFERTADRHREARPPTFGRAFTGAPVSASPAAALLRASALGRPREELLPHPERVFDQSDVNCCVSCAIASAMEILNPEWPDLAPLFHFWVARFDAIGAADPHGNLYLDGGLQVATSDGVCRYRDHSAEEHGAAFTHSGAQVQPRLSAYTDARQRRLPRLGPYPGYRKITGGSRYNQIKGLIDGGQPALLGLILPRAYPKDFLDSSGRWLDPEVPGDNVYRHCVLATGYNDAKSALRVLDSRGPDEFDHGSWWIGPRVVDSSAVEEVFALPL